MRVRRFRVEMLRKAYRPIDKEIDTLVAGGGIRLTLDDANFFLALFQFDGLRTFENSKKQRDNYWAPLPIGRSSKGQCTGLGSTSS